jgi:hypothetical protein
MGMASDEESSFFHKIWKNTEQLLSIRLGIGGKLYLSSKIKE